MIGGQGVFVTLAASNITNVDGIFAFDVALTNLLRQPLGTEDGINPAPGGIRIFFHSGPNATVGAGDVSLANEDGTDTFTGSDQPYFEYEEIVEPNQTSSAKNWQIAYDPDVEAFAFTVYVSAPVQFEQGWIDVMPAAIEILPSGTVQLSGTIYDFVGRVQSDSISWSSEAEEVAAVDADGLVTGVAAGTATITGSATIMVGGAPTVVTGAATILVNTPTQADDAAFDVVSNLTLDIPEATGLRQYATDPDGGPVTIIADTLTTVEGGSVAIASNGAFTYRTPVGFLGRDSVQYAAVAGADTASAWLKLVAERRFWHVTAGAAAGDGTDQTPHTHLTDVGPLLAAGDTVLVRNGDDSDVLAGITLPDSVGVIGEGIGADLTIELNGDTLTVLIAGPTPSVTRSTAGATITLGRDNVLRGLEITAAAGAAVTGTDFGTLRVGELSIIAVGPAFDLADGTVAGDLTQLSSASSATRGLRLVNVGGTISPASGSIGGATTEAVYLSGGTVDLEYAGAISHSGSGALLSVAGAHSGEVTLNGEISATGGTGLQFDDADGNYAINPVSATTLTGDGVTIGNGSSGSFTFGANLNVTNTSGSAVPFSVSASAPNITFNGDLSVGGTATGRLLSVVDQTAGTINFQTGALSATSGTGILLSNADGIVNFNGPVTLNGGDAGVDVENNSSGTFTFPVSASITNPSGALISILSSSPSFTYPGSFSKTNSGVGIVVQSSGGTITFGGSGVTKLLSTSTADAVSLTNNSGAITFSGGGLAITTTSGAGFTATGGGTVSVTGADNTVNTTAGGAAVNIQNTTIAGLGVTFRSVNSSGGGINGILLANTGSGGFQVTGDGASDPDNTTRGRTTAGLSGTIGMTSGGTITGKSGAAIHLTNTGAIILRNMAVQNNSSDGIEAHTVAGMTLDNVLITGHADYRGLYATAVNDLAIQHSQIGSNATTAAAGMADRWNVDLQNATGTASITNSRLFDTLENGLHALNTSGSLNLTVSNTTVQDVTGGNAVGIYPQGTSNVTAAFQNDSIVNASARGISVGSGVGSSAVVNYTVNNSHFVDQFVSIEAAHGSSATFTFNITNNTTRTSVPSSAQAININRLGTGAFGAPGLFTGTISGNTIGVAGVANSGSDVGDGINVESNGSGGITRVAVLNNTIREVGQRGIYLAAVDTDIGGYPRPVFEARVQGNNIADFKASALHGIQGLMGALSTDDPIMCFNISGNTITNPPSNGIRIRTSGLPAATPTVTFHAWDGSTPVGTYLATQNTISGAEIAATNYLLGGGTAAPGNCSTP